jgi:NADH:ubiquinone oxidoreductase subunit 6 (subunit J)
MEFLNFLRDDPVMAWLVFLGLLLTVVPVAAMLWRKMSGNTPVEEEKPPAQAAKPVRFGNQTELALVLVGVLLLLAIVGWIRHIFFG